MFITARDKQRDGRTDTANYTYGFTFAIFLNPDRPVHHSLP